MNVIVTNKQKDIIDNANIDAIKDFNGLFNVDDLISKVKNYFFSKLILDATSIVNFSSKEVLEKLVSSIGADRLIILLPTDLEPPKSFIDLLVSLKIFNFSRDINEIIKFITVSNSYENIVGITGGVNNDIYVDSSIKATDNFQPNESITPNNMNPTMPFTTNSRNIFSPIITGAKSGENVQNNQPTVNNIPTNNVPYNNYPGLNNVPMNNMNQQNNNYDFSNNYNGIISNSSVVPNPPMNTPNMGVQNNAPDNFHNTEILSKMPQYNEMINGNPNNNIINNNPISNNSFNNNVMTNQNINTVNNAFNSTEMKNSFNDFYNSSNATNNNDEQNNSGFYQEFDSSTKSFVLGVKNITVHAGSTTLVYLMMKAAREILNLRVNAIEVNKNDFKYYNDNDMISTTTDALPNVIDGSNANLIIVDLNDYYGNFSIFNDVIYLVEPSVIRLNKLMIDNRFAFKENAKHKLLLNMSLLNLNEVDALSKEAGVEFLLNIPPINDRVHNDIILKILNLFGFKK